MSLTYETLNILFFLIPGFFSALILDSVITRKTKNSFAIISEALVFSFLIYAIQSFIYKWEPLIVSTDSSTLSTSYTFSSDSISLILILVASIVLPLFVGASIHHDWHTGFFRKIGITDKTSRISTWHDAFINESGYVIVTLRDMRRIHGWPKYYSHQRAEGELFLHDPAWIVQEGENEPKYLPTKTKGMLLSSDDIKFIEFLEEIVENEQK